MRRSIKILPFIKMYWITLGLMLALFLFYTFHLFQALFSLTAPEEISVVILLITAILWISEIVPLFVASLGVLLMSLIWLLPGIQSTGMVATKEDFFLSFFSDITLLFMGGFVLSLLLNKYRLAQLLARQILNKTGGRPSNVLLAIIMVSSVLSMWMSNTATAAMMLAIVAPLIYQLPDESPFAKALAIAIPFACNLGGLGTPIGTPPNAIAMEYLNQVGIGLTFSKWMIICIPIMLLMLFLLWKLLLRLFPPGDFLIELEEAENSELSKRQYLVMGIFLLTIIGWMTTGLTGLTTGIVGLIVVLVSFGSNLLQARDFRNLSWDILFMLGGGLCLGAGLNKSGMTDTIAQYIDLSSGFWMVFVLLMILASMMTTFMSNTATANLLIPVAVSLQQSEILLAISIAIMCSSSMALPVSTPPNAIAFGSGLLKSKDLLGPGLLITVIAILAVVVVGLFYLPLFL